MNESKIPRTSVAIVMNDMINGTLRTGDSTRDEAIAASEIIQNTASVTAALRAIHIPVMWIRIERRADRADVVNNIVDRYPRGYRLPPWTAGSVEAQNVAELPVVDGDQVILKPRMDPFVATDLDLQLRARGIKTIVLGGYSTNGGVESCARTAYCLGYDVVVLSDCCFNVETDLHEYSLTRILPWYARVRTSSQVLELFE